MIQRATYTLSQLYEADETAWLDAMAELIEQGRLDSLDYSHLGEYLGDMARRDRREVKSRMLTLLAHLLKWEHQPEKRTGSWRATIFVQQTELADLAENGVLRNHAEEVLRKVYEDAVEVAAAETGLRQSSFPAECPYTVEQLFSTDFTADK
jgi:Domain of unknown function DUF29